MKFRELSEEDKDLIKKQYRESDSREEAQKTLSEYFEVNVRTIRNWANLLEEGLLKKNVANPNKILVYDIETSRTTALVWWTGKQYISHDQLREEPKIITIAWKWLGEDKVHTLNWDKDGSDQEMMVKFLKQYNKADMVIGQNNDRFDNRWINARAMKYRLDVNVHVRSFDIMKETKRLFRLPSYSMKYITKFLGIEEKLKHEGLIMWDMVQFGTPKQKKEYLQKMLAYNRQDIVATEDMYITLRKYMGHKMHFGVLNGEPSFTCPNCGGRQIKVDKTTVTPAGTVQRIMKCQFDQTTFKLANSKYMKYLEWKLSENIPLNER